MDSQKNDPISDISRQRIQALYPGLRPLAFKVLQDSFKIFGRPMNVVQGLRNMDEQMEIYKQGRILMNGTWTIHDSGKIVTNARPGLSYHNYGLAFDCAFAGSDPYMEKLLSKEQNQTWETYGHIVVSYGMVWGGNFRLKNGAKDKPHAELAYGMQIHECLELYNQGGLHGVWAHLDKIREVSIGQDWMA